MRVLHRLRLRMRVGVVGGAYDPHDTASLNILRYAIRTDTVLGTDKNKAAAAFALEGKLS